MRLIGITGKARAGKDTFAAALIKAGYSRIAFADAVKRVTALIADEPEHLYFDDATKEQVSPSLGIPRRKAMQLVGTEAVRKTLGDNVWVDRALRAWVRDGRPSAVISDVRFDNEAQAILALGGHIVRIVRPDNVGLTGTEAAHVSEAGVSEDLIDIEVVNNGSIGDLHAEARKLVQLLAGDEERE